jgi:pyrimidine-nucleoside phosphorylase
LVRIQDLLWFYVTPMNFLPVLELKREGGILTPGQLQDLVSALTAGRVPDYQLSAFLMAVFFQGLNPEETRTLTLAMRDSGEVLSFPSDPRPLVDKHSTGGIGDKVSLPLAPLLAALGFRVPMISGRGLGITGGTLDKLDSIPGFQTTLPSEQIVRLVQQTGCVICGQTDQMVPADKKMYALRDVTGTVPSIPLIVASILSKKMAEGISALVLDVKFGRAAFMRTPEQASALAGEMVRLGNACGISTVALLTRMDTPIGRSAGNWLEVKEAVDFLDGKTEALEDLEALVIDCAAHLLVQTKKSQDLHTARETARECLLSGQPRRKWDQMLEAQGADLDAFGRKLQTGGHAPAVSELRAPRPGIVTRCDGRIIGEVVRDLGGGRLNQDSLLDYIAGVDALAKPGDAVSESSVLARVHACDQARATAALETLKGAFQIADTPPEKLPQIAEVIGG